MIFNPLCFTRWCCDYLVKNGTEVKLRKFWVEAAPVVCDHAAPYSDSPRNGTGCGVGRPQPFSQLLPVLSHLLPLSLALIRYFHPISVPWHWTFFFHKHSTSVINWAFYSPSSLPSLVLSVHTPGMFLSAFTNQACEYHYFKSSVHQK